MRLSELLSALPREFMAPEKLASSENPDPVIRGLSYDSREVCPGDLFVALSGSQSDGHDFIPRALESGAVAVLAERPAASGKPMDCPTVFVPDSRRALAPLAVRFFGQPARELRMVGVTGTNGKTSTACLVESILGAAGVNAGLIGTVGIRYAEENETATNTTPESLDLQRTLRAMRTRNVETCVMEVSSHGLELGRVEGCRFEVAAFTNLTQDHLDFHGDMETYLKSKSLLFSEYLLGKSHAVINIDDPSASVIIDAARESGAEIIRCSRDSGKEAEIRLLGSDIHLSGTEAWVDNRGEEIELSLPLIGDFNLENLIVACGVASALGIDSEVIASGISTCPQVPGRMQVVSRGREEDPTVIVDYAHTPDAVEKLLKAVRPLCGGRLISVFGCGGDRDRSKRPRMAEAVAQHSDLALATSDNPRTEEPGNILLDVEEGLAALEKAEVRELDQARGRYIIIEDRREAIGRAIANANPEDTVVLAGKGHEDYQIIGTRKFPFDDREEALAALAQRGDP